MLALVVGVYLIVDFFEKIDSFIENSIPFTKALLFFSYKIPFIFAQMLPVCVLLSILVVFGLMNKNHEITALKSSGISIYFLFKPVLILGTASTLLLFAFSEFIVPFTTIQANKIWLREIKKESAVISREKNIWIKGEGYIAHIRYYNAKKKALYDLTLNRFDNNFKLVQRLDAKKGVFQQGQWTLIQVMDQKIEGVYGKSTVRYYNSKTERLGFLPEDLQRVVKKSEEMNFRELSALIEKIESEGYDATSYRVDLYAKTAFPFVCIIMSLMGTGIALRAKPKEGLAPAIALGIFIAFLYWIFYSFCVSLGYGEMLPPVIASWLANIVFICLGAFSLLLAE